MSRFLDICRPITEDLHAMISAFAPQLKNAAELLRNVLPLSSDWRSRLALFFHLASSFTGDYGGGWVCGGVQGGADVILSWRVINNHTGNHCHRSEEMHRLCLSNENRFDIRRGFGFCDSVD